MKLDEVKSQLTDLYRKSSYRGNTTIVPDEDHPEYERILLMVEAAKASAGAYYYALLLLERHTEGENFDVNRWHIENKF